MAIERGDGRQYDELRPLEITRSYLNTVPGSALIKMGQTWVICTVSWEDRVPPFLVGKKRGWLTAEYGMLPGSSNKRIAREGTGGRVNNRAREIQRLIGRSLRAIVDLESIGENTLYVDCDVIQADGGTRTASITGAYVALAEAVEYLLKEGKLSRNPLLKGMAAISVGLVEGQALLDLCYEEDARAETDMNVVMTEADGIVEIQATAEGRPFTRRENEHLLDLASRGIESLLEVQRQVLANPV